MDSDSNRSEIFRVRTHNLDTVPAAGLAIERLTMALGLASLEASRFRTAVEELCAERINGAFAPEERAEAYISLEVHPGEVVVVVQDSGSPVEMKDTAAGAKGWLAQLMRRGFADRLHASFEGREGNRCEIVKFLGRSALTGAQALPASEAATKADVEADSAKPGTAAKAPAIQYRNMAPDDALAVARCFYRTYGLTGPVADEVIYHPERCAAQARAELYLGVVAMLPDGRVVGHIAVERQALDDPVGIGGFLVVDPEFRGHGIAERLSELKVARARAAGLRGLLGMTVTVHTASQKTSLSHGGHEVGVLLAAQEDRIVMRGIATGARQERHAIVAFYTPLAADVRRPSFPPAAQREIVARICAACGLNRVINESRGRVSLDELPQRTSLSVAVLSGAHFARIRVSAFGRDFVSEIFHLIDDLHRHNIDVLRLELPLADPLTAHFGSAAEELGFSFAAVFPAMGAGDLLCLQSLDRIEVDPTAIQTASDLGAAVLAAVLASRQRVLSSNTARTLEGAKQALTSTANPV